MVQKNRTGFVTSQKGYAPMRFVFAEKNGAG
jgi:hypothetical protein